MRATGLIVMTMLLLSGALFAASGLEVGAQLPDFREMAISGRTVESSTLRGHPLLVWFTCFSEGEVAAAPELLGIRTRHPALGVLIVSLNGPYDEKARAFARAHAAADRIAIDSDGSTVQTFTGTFIEGSQPLYNLYLFDEHGRLSLRCHYPGKPPRDVENELLRL